MPYNEALGGTLIERAIRERIVLVGVTMPEPGRWSFALHAATNGSSHCVSRLFHHHGENRRSTGPSPTT